MSLIRREDSRRLNRAGGNRIPARLRNAIPEMIAQQFSMQPSCRLIVHASIQNEHDATQRRILEGMLPAFRTRPIDQYIEEESRRSVVGSECEGEKSNPNQQLGVGLAQHEIVEHASEQHVLPRELAQAQQWLPLLKLEVGNAIMN
jgi:hypothetical protein